MIAEPDLADGLKQNPLLARRRERRGEDIGAAFQTGRPADAYFIHVLKHEEPTQGIP
jgi:hypothetical protein